MIFAVMAYFSFSLLDAVQKTAIMYHSIFQLLKTFIFVTLLLLHVAQQGLEYAIAYKVRHSGTFKRISKMQYVGVPRIPPSI